MSFISTSTDLTETIAIADLSDVGSVTGTGTVVVMQGSPTLTTPTIASFTYSAHDHEDAAGGGQLDHGLAITGLTDDDHTQYALLAGRSGGQTIIGGTANGNSATIRATAGTVGPIIFEGTSGTEYGRWDTSGYIG